jgi:hypothetical protein
MMERELDASEEHVVNVLASLVSRTTAESFIAKSENLGLLTGECLIDCTLTMCDGLYVGSASRCQSSVASEVIPDVREDDHCVSNTQVSIPLENTANGMTANTEGCREMMEGGADIIIGPQGDEYTSIPDAYGAVAEPVSVHYKYEWTKNTVSSTDKYAHLQININGGLYPVVPIFADEKAICIGLPSELCLWLEQLWICTDPEDLVVIKGYDPPMVEMCFLWVAVCAGDAFQIATPEVLPWRKATHKGLRLNRWPSARALKEIDIPRTVHVTGEVYMDLRWGLPDGSESQTVQELDLVLRSGISRGPWQFYTKIQFLTKDTPSQGFPGHIEKVVPPIAASANPTSERSVTVKFGYNSEDFIAAEASQNYSKLTLCWREKKVPALMIARRIGGALLGVPTGYIDFLDLDTGPLGVAAKLSVSMRVDENNRECSDQVLSVIVFDMSESFIADRLRFYGDSDVELGAFPIDNVEAFGEAEGWPLGPELVAFTNHWTNFLRTAGGVTPSRAAIYFIADEESRRRSDVASIPSALACRRQSAPRRPLALTSIEEGSSEKL